MVHSKGYLIEQELLFFRILTYGDPYKMCNKKVSFKIVAAIVIIVALALGIAVSVLPQPGLVYIIAVTRFFDVMLPVLAVGALIKYILCGGRCCNKDQEGVCGEKKA